MPKSKKKKPVRSRRKQGSKSKRRAGLYRTTQVMLRVTSEEKRMMIRGAARDGDSLSTWLRRLALRRVKQLRLTLR